MQQLKIIFKKKIDKFMNSWIRDFVGFVKFCVFMKNNMRLMVNEWDTSTTGTSAKKYVLRCLKGDKIGNVFCGHYHVFLNDIVPCE